VNTQDGRWISARRETIRTYYPAIGRLQARQRTKLGPQVSGRVEEILVDVGDTVNRDQVLLRLDPELFEIEVRQREADVHAAKVTLADAELNYQRMENLWKKPDGQEPSIPKKLFDDAKTRLESSTAAVNQAEEALHRARERLSECVIRAPYDGVITERLVDVGESVNSAPVTHLLEIAEVSTLELEFSLPQGMLSRVREGTPLLYRTEGVAGDYEPGVISTVFPIVDESTRTFRCRVLVDNSSSRYLPGLLVEVRLVKQELEDALCVPRASVLRADGALAVLVRTGDKPERRSVQIAFETDDRVAVAEGLSEGEEVWVPEEIRS
jgi:membrane fusion protein (multidrug efflux system)